MAYFRMAPLHSVARHRAMNMFLRAYRELWLEAEEDIRACFIEDLCNDSYEMDEQDVTTMKEETETKTNRGAAETVLLYISASENNEMLRRTLQLGISLLHGGNREVQKLLDLNTFERCIKAEVLGVGSEGIAGENNLHDADFIISLFRFCQLLCEGYHLEFQNYLRLRAGSSTNVNIIICTVDYLRSLQELLMYFYWHYSDKETVDAHRKEYLCRAINVAKQVFNTLTEYIQGPCPQDQLALANSRLCDAIAEFLYISACMQRKLFQDPTQIELLREFMKLQKEMFSMDQVFFCDK
ncbi:unnamed protein product [Rotaria sp. Silwood1]|nr:unnamed protein product [Rotaria sp. Silwood1]